MLMKFRLAARLKSLKDISPVRLIVSSFLIIIILGTCLLCMPISLRDKEQVSVIDAMFTATSATCVTGLTVFDTYTKWSGFGQLVIILLIQLGGLGIISFTTGFTMIFRKKLGLRDMQIAKEHTNGSMIDTPKLIKTILIWTTACEALGTLLFAIRFVPKYGIRGIWISVFTAISAYCNAGFDIMGFENPGGNFIDYAGDPLVSLTIAFLVVIGGLGFIVVGDIYSCIIKKKEDRKLHPRLNLHSTIVIYTSLALLIVGTVLFMVFEYDNTLRGMSFFEKLNVSFFQSAVARTAGFFTVPISMERRVTKILTMILMFIGASPSSTGGGIKTTTFVVILATVYSVIKGYDDTIIARHKVEKATVYKAFTLTLMAFLLVSMFTTAISAIQIQDNIPIIDIVFETVSAFGTVGITSGVTGKLVNVSKLLIIILMFIGRVGPISFVIAATLKRGRGSSDKILPSSRIVVG